MPSALPHPSLVQVRHQKQQELWLGRTKGVHLGAWAAGVKQLPHNLRACCDQGSLLFKKEKMNNSLTRQQGCFSRTRIPSLFSNVRLSTTQSSILGCRVLRIWARRCLRTGRKPNSPSIPSPPNYGPTAPRLSPQQWCETHLSFLCFSYSPLKHCTLTPAT